MNTAGPPKNGPAGMDAYEGGETCDDQEKRPERVAVAEDHNHD